MASNRARANNSLTNKVISTTSKVSDLEKKAPSRVATDAVGEGALAPMSVTSTAIAPDAITQDKIASGSVGTRELGLVETVTSSGNFTFRLPPGKTLFIDDGTGTLVPVIKEEEIENQTTVGTKPTTPIEGDFWMDSKDGTLYVRYVESDGTGHWVAVGTEGVSPALQAEMDFPTSPVDGQTYLNYVYSSSAGAWKRQPVNIGLPAGAIMPWPTSTAPTNWLICDGSLVSRTTYATLFALIGTTYGAGDGTSTFALPNLKGRTVVGRDSAQTEFDTLAETGGAKTHTLAATELAPHSHDFGGDDMMETQGGYYRTGSFAYDATSSPSGGGGNFRTRNMFAGWPSSVTPAITSASPHNNLQPYVVLNYIIKTTHSDTPGDSLLTQRVSALESQNTGPTTSMNRIRLAATDDASDASTDHAIQVGPTSGVNLVIDNNEIIARNNGAFSQLYLTNPTVTVDTTYPPTSAYALTTKLYVDDLARGLGTTWTDLPLTNGWALYTTSGWSGGAYLVRNGVVYLSGVISKTDYVAGDTVCTLPVGARPSRRVRTSGEKGGALTWFQIEPTGVVTVSIAGTGTIALTGSFPV